MFEFGTCTGKTPYLWSVNSAANARISSLTLAPNGPGDYQHATGDSAEADELALTESAFTTFYCTGTPAAGKIEQIYGDSKIFDEARFAGRCDLIFVDGSHAYSYVKNDSIKALRMVAPGGIILSRDYRGPFGKTKDVFRYLNRLATERWLVRFDGTALVAYRALAEHREFRWRVPRRTPRASGARCLPTETGGPARVPGPRDRCGARGRPGSGPSGS